MIAELQLDRAFVDKIETSKTFVTWLLKQTKFEMYANTAILLNKEQAELKPKKKPENWWRHWWCKLSDGSESETDIFLVFKVPDSNSRFALHIEDKPPHGKFTPKQYLNYKKRAEYMSEKDEYMNYSDYTTILLAPNSFLKANTEKTNYFDVIVSYESVAKFIPLFEDSIKGN